MDSVWGRMRKQAARSRPRTMVSHVGGSPVSVATMPPASPRSYYSLKRTSSTEWMIVSHGVLLSGSLDLREEPTALQCDAMPGGCVVLQPDTSLVSFVTLSSSPQRLHGDPRAEGPAPISFPSVPSTAAPGELAVPSGGSSLQPSPILLAAHRKSPLKVNLPAIFLSCCLSINTYQPPLQRIQPRPPSYPGQNYYCLYRVASHISCLVSGSSLQTVQHCSQGGF